MALGPNVDYGAQRFLQVQIRHVEFELALLDARGSARHSTAPAEHPQVANGVNKAPLITGQRCLQQLLARPDDAVHGRRISWLMLAKNRLFTRPSLGHVFGEASNPKPASPSRCQPTGQTTAPARVHDRQMGPGKLGQKFRVPYTSPSTIRACPNKRTTQTFHNRVPGGAMSPCAMVMGPLPSRQWSNMFRSARILRPRVWDPHH